MAFRGNAELASRKRGQTEEHAESMADLKMADLKMADRKMAER